MTATVGGVAGLVAACEAATEEVCSCGYASHASWCPAKRLATALTAWRERPREYPGQGSAWADFLWHRARVLCAWEGDDKSPEESAAEMAMDPGQVRLILATYRERFASPAGKSRSK